MRDAADEAHAVAALERAAQRAVAGVGQRPLAERGERVGEPDDVLALLERADAEEPRRAVRRRRDGELLPVDAARDDLRLAARLRQPRLELAAQVLRDADDGRGAADDEARGRGDAGELADVADVAAVGGDDERRPRRERGDQPRRDEEVRVDDVGPEAAAGAVRPGGERQVAGLAAGARVEHRPLDLVAARDERALHLGDERAEVGRVRARVHLRDEQDPHPRSLTDPGRRGGRRGVHPGHVIVASA